MSNNKDQKNGQNVSTGFTIVIVFITLYLVIFKGMPFWLVFVLPIAGIILDITFSSKKSSSKEQTKNNSIAPPPTPQDNFQKRLGQQRTMLSRTRSSKIGDAKLAKAERSKPVTTFSVSKVGEYNDFHYYDTPSEDYVGEVAEVDEDVQYDLKDREREVHVVNVRGSSIGEVTNSTVEKLNEITDNFYDLIYIVASVTETDDPERPRVKIAAYDIPESSVVRVWRLPLVGIPYNNRSKRLVACGIGIYGLKVTSYENAPAIMVLDPFGNDVGFIPKEHAEEVTNYYNEGRITCARVSKIEPTPNGGLYADLELEILR